MVGTLALLLGVSAYSHGASPPIAATSGQFIITGRVCALPLDAVTTVWIDDEVAAHANECSSPIASALVILEQPGTRNVKSRTDEQGNFTLSVPRHDLGKRASILVQAEGHQAFRLGSVGPGGKYFSKASNTALFLIPPSACKPRGK